MEMPDMRLSQAGSASGFPSTSRYVARSRFLFEGLDLANGRVLDVGCGRGAFSLWAALQGASSVLAIEPEAHGSSSGTLSSLQLTVDQLDMADRIEPRAAFLDDVRADDGPFDTVVMHNVINHIDEDAVAKLPQDVASRDSFLRSLRHLRGLVTEGATVIVADAARWNVWDQLGIRSPLARTIEWEKHAEPEVWISLFGGAGFTLRDLRWSPLWPVPRLTGNRMVQRLTASHFVIRFTSF